MPSWMLLDYGQVLSTAPPADEWDALRRAAGPLGADAERFHSLYWEYRPEYDRADLGVEEYWSQVLGSAPSPDQLGELVHWDVTIWLHPHEAAVEAAHRAADRGWQLALFSNAPVEVAAGIDTLEWLEPVEPRFFSCHLRRIKPEPEAYRQVMAGLGADASDIVFLDDRPVNVEAARSVGMQAEVFTEPAQIDRLVAGSDEVE